MRSRFGGLNIPLAPSAAAASAAGSSGIGAFCERRPGDPPGR